MFVHLYIDDWESDQTSLSEDEHSPINESVGPDHLTKNE